MRMGVIQRGSPQKIMYLLKVLVHLLFLHEKIYESRVNLVKLESCISVQI